MTEFFEQFLAKKHYEENPTLLDDALPDAFDSWLSELQADDFIKYGNEYAELEYLRGKEEVK